MRTSNDSGVTTSNEYVARMLEYLPPEIRPMYAAAPDLLEALRELLACADKVVYRPSVDDSRQIDRDTRELRAAGQRVRALLAARSK